MNELFKKRRSIRSYTDEEITDIQLNEVLFAAMVAPSANHVNPWEFIVVKNKDSLRRLSEIGMWQKFIAESNVSIVITANPINTDKWVQDCSIAAAHIYLEATNQGLGVCWANVMGNINKENEKEKLVKRVLNIPDTHRVLCIMTLGHPAKEIEEHTEDDYRADKVHEEQW
jgi:nitroreductase